MSRLFLCLITHNQYENVKSLTDPIWEHIDGIISVDAGSTDGTRELLEERKGQGEVLYRKWTNDHDLQQNVWLRESVLKEGDIVLIRDSCERFNPEWAKKIRNFLDTLIFGGVRSIFNYGKLFAFVWSDSIVCQGSPHWGMVGLQHKMIDLKEYHNEDLHEWSWRVRDGEEGGRPIDNKIDHEAKYYWTYGRSNHLLLGRENNIEEYQRLEMIRGHIRDQARLLGFSMDLKGLEDFMRWITSDEVEDQTKINGKNWINSNHITKNFYRKHIAKDSWEDIISTENSWTLEY